MRVEMFTFLVTGALCIAGSLGVILFRNPIHAALSLIGTLFSIAVLFVAQGAYFLAAIQVIVYAGAIVILFMFVLMLLGVDRVEEVETEPLVSMRTVGISIGVAIFVLVCTALITISAPSTGAESTYKALDPTTPDVNQLGESLFTDYIYAFQITAVLLTVAVVGAVILARRAGDPIDLEEFPEGTVPEARERELREELERIAAEEAERQAAEEAARKAAEEEKAAAMAAASTTDADEDTGGHEEEATS